MKNILRLCVLLLLFATANSILTAQTPANVRLDANGVSAGFNSNGDLFWNYSTPQFEVPKGSQKNTIFAGALWIGGLDSGGELHLAAQTYRQTGNDFYPGPVMNAAAYSAATDVQWNKVWKINKTAIDSFCTWWVNHSVYASYTIPNSILNWPANGNVSLGQAAVLAPYVDVNGDNYYDPNSGDYPCIKGDQAVYMIFNDDRNAHGETGGQKMKVEVHAMAYSFIAPGLPMDSVVFLNYKIINRSSNDYSQCYLASWMDFDIGAYDDDYIGCDVERNMFYGYNGDGNDGVSATAAFGTYGANPPAEGVLFLRGPEADAGDGIDNNRNGTVDETGEFCRMNKFIYYNNDLTTMGNPIADTDYYHYMCGFWKDGSPLTYGGNGYGGSVVTDAMFPGASDPLGLCTNMQPQAPWNEATVGNVPGDRRGLGASGKFTFSAGEEMCLDFGFLYARGINGPASSIAELQWLADSISTEYPTMNTCTCVPNPLGIENSQEVNSVSVYPNPAENYFTVNWKPESQNARMELYDVNGKCVMVKVINRELTDVDTRDVAPGIYLLVIKDGANMSSVKLIIR